MPTPVEEAYNNMMAAEARSRAMSSAYATGAIDPWTGRPLEYNNAAYTNAVAQAQIARENYYVAYAGVGVPRSSESSPSSSSGGGGGSPPPPPLSSDPNDSKAYTGTMSASAGGGYADSYSGAGASPSQSSAASRTALAAGNTELAASIVAQQTSQQRSTPISLMPSNMPMAEEYNTMAVAANALRQQGATPESVQSSVNQWVDRQRYTPNYNPVNSDGTINRVYVGEGRYMQQELINPKVGAAGGGNLEASTGEYAVYRLLPKDQYGNQRYNRDVNTGEMTPYMLFGGGGRAALQSGTVGFAAATKAVYAEGRVGQGEFKTPDVMSVGAYDSKVTAEQIKTAVKEGTAGSLLSRLGAEAYGGVVTLQDNRVLGKITYEDVSNRAAWNLASYVNPTDVNKSKAELPGVNIPWGITADYPAFFPITTAGAQKTAVPVKSFEAYLSGDMRNYQSPSTSPLGGEIATTTKNNAQVAASMEAMGYPLSPNLVGGGKVASTATTVSNLGDMGLPKPFMSGGGISVIDKPSGEFDSSRGFLQGLLPQITPEQASAYATANKSNPMGAVIDAAVSGTRYGKSAALGAFSEITGGLSETIFPAEKFVSQKAVPAQYTWKETTEQTGGSAEQDSLYAYLTSTKNSIDVTDIKQVNKYNEARDRFLSLEASNPTKIVTTQTPTLVPGTGIEEERMNQWQLFSRGSGEVGRYLTGETIAKQNAYYETIKNDSSMVGEAKRAVFFAGTTAINNPAALAPAAIQGAAFVYGGGALGAGVGYLATGTGRAANVASMLMTPGGQTAVKTVVALGFGGLYTKGITEDFTLRPGSGKISENVYKSIPTLAAMYAGGGGIDWVGETRVVNRVTPSGGTVRGIDINNQFFGGGTTPAGRPYAAVGNIETGFSSFVFERRVTSGGNRVAGEGTRQYAEPASAPGMSSEGRGLGAAPEGTIFGETIRADSTPFKTYEPVAVKNVPSAQNMQVERVISDRFIATKSPLGKNTPLVLEQVWRPRDYTIEGKVKQQSSTTMSGRSEIGENVITQSTQPIYPEHIFGNIGEGYYTQKATPGIFTDAELAYVEGVVSTGHTNRYLPAKPAPRVGETDQFEFVINNKRVVTQRTGLPEVRDKWGRTGDSYVAHSFVVPSGVSPSDLSFAKDFSMITGAKKPYVQNIVMEPADIVATKKPIASWEQRNLDIQTGKRTSTPTPEEIAFFNAKHGEGSSMIKSIRGKPRKGAMSAGGTKRNVGTVVKTSTTVSNDYMGGYGKFTSGMREGGTGGGGGGAISRSRATLSPTTVTTVATKVFTSPISRTKSVYKFEGRAKSAAEYLATGASKAKSKSTPYNVGDYDGKSLVESESTAGAVAAAKSKASEKSLTNFKPAYEGVSVFKEVSRGGALSVPSKESKAMSRARSETMGIAKAKGESRELSTSRGISDMVSFVKSSGSITPRPMPRGVSELTRPTGKAITGYERPPDKITSYIRPTKGITTVPPPRITQPVVREKPPYIPPKITEVPPPAKLPPPPLIFPPLKFDFGGGSSGGAGGMNRGAGARREIIAIRSSLDYFLPRRRR